MVRMGACRVPDRGSIPRRGDFFLFLLFLEEVNTTDTANFKFILDDL